MNTYINVVAITINTNASINKSLLIRTEATPMTPLMQYKIRTVRRCPMPTFMTRW